MVTSLMREMGLKAIQPRTWKRTTVVDEQPRSSLTYWKATSARRGVSQASGWSATSPTCGPGRWDNAAAESFFSSLKNEMYFHQVIKTRGRARFAVANHIAVFYNRIKLQSTVGYRTPVDAWSDHTTRAAGPAAA